MSSEETYRRWISAGSKMVESALAEMGDYPVERHWIAHYGVGLDARMAALGYFALDMVDKGLGMLRLSADSFAKSFLSVRDDINRDNVNAEMLSLECAILTGEQAFAKSIADVIPVYTGKRKLPELPYVMFIKHALLGEENMMMMWAQEAGSVSPAMLQKRGGYRNLGTLCMAIADADEVRTKSELMAMLSQHEHKAKLAWKSLPQGYICLPGATLAFLAKWRGLKVNIDSKHIPTVLMTPNNLA